MNNKKTTKFAMYKPTSSVDWFKCKEEYTFKGTLSELKNLKKVITKKEK